MWGNCPWCVEGSSEPPLRIISTYSPSSEIRYQQQVSFALPCQSSAGTLRSTARGFLLLGNTLLSNGQRTKGLLIQGRPKGGSERTLAGGIYRCDLQSLGILGKWTKCQKKRT